MKRATIIRTLWHWHRRIGLLACALIIVLSITGILANHSSQLGWDRSPISVQWILNSYGFNAPETYQGLAVDEHLWVIGGTQLFRDDVSVATCSSDWHSVIWLDPMVIASCASKVELFSTDGDRIEIFSALPEGRLIKSGRIKNDGRLLLQFTQNQYLLDVDSFEVTAVSGYEMILPQWQSVPAPMTQSLQSQFRVQDLTWERFILDVHAGRWFGGWGWLLMDLGAIFMLTLALSGVVMYVLRRTR